MKSLIRVFHREALIEVTGMLKNWASAASVFISLKTVKCAALYNAEKKFWEE